MRLGKRKGRGVASHICLENPSAKQNVNQKVEKKQRERDRERGREGKEAVQTTRMTLAFTCLLSLTDSTSLHVLIMRHHISLPLRI